MQKKFIIIISSLFLLFGIWFLWNHQYRALEDASLLEAVSPYRDAEITAEINPAEGNTFGYDIYVYGSVMVHQPSRPGLPGNAGFATEEAARKVADLVIRKIRNNELPPTVTIEELRELGVL